MIWNGYEQLNAIWFSTVLDLIWKCTRLMAIYKWESTQIIRSLVDKLSDRFSLRTWDAIDGLRFPKQSHLTLFNDLMEQNAPSEDGDEYDLVGPRADDIPGDIGGCVSAPAAYRDPAFAFDAMRQVLTTSSVQRPMFIVDWGSICSQLPISKIG